MDHYDWTEDSHYEDFSEYEEKDEWLVYEGIPKDVFMEGFDESDARWYSRMYGVEFTLRNGLVSIEGFRSKLEPIYDEYDLGEYL